LERYSYFDELFSKFDRDDNGLIDLEEFNALSEGRSKDGFNLPEKEECLKQMDADKNLKINFNEFVR
jgi:Ca2+-binding EF-hand superfamily protein